MLDVPDIVDIPGVFLWFELYEFDISKTIIHDYGSVH